MGIAFKGNTFPTDPYACSDWGNRDRWPDSIFYSQRECWTSSRCRPDKDKYPSDWKDGDIREVLGRSEYVALHSEGRIRGLESIELSVSDGVHPVSVSDVTDAEMSLNLVRQNVRNAYRELICVSHMSMHVHRSVPSAPSPSM